jgi:hypothetical protein
MFSIPQFKNAGAWLKSYLGLAPFTATAGGAGDAAAQLGPAIERKGALSCVIAVPYVTTGVGGTDKVDFTLKVKHGPTSALATGYYTQPAYSGSANKTHTSTVGADESSVFEFDVNLEGADLFIGAEVTADLSAAATDTATFAAVVTLAGYSDGDSAPLPQ